jgi:phosphoglycolate phosphatase
LPLIVFDLDGTLVDSQRDLADAANALILERGGRPQPVEAIAKMVGEGAALLVRRALTAAGLDADDPVALPRFLQLYDERLLNHTRLYDGMRDALDALAAKATLAVLTNKPQRPTEEILAGVGVAPLFKWAIGGDTSFGRKPSAAGFLELAKRANEDPRDVWMVGDSPIDLRTARAAGSRVCLARYGFGFRVAPEEFRGDELFADTPADIVAIACAA